MITMKITTISFKSGVSLARCGFLRCSISLRRDRGKILLKRTILKLIIARALSLKQLFSSTIEYLGTYYE